MLHYGEGKRCPFFRRWCRRYAAHYAAVGAACYNTGRVNAARFFSAVGVSVILPFTAVDAAFSTTANVNAARRSAVGVGVMPPHSLLLVPPFTLRLGETLSVLVQPLV